jgi:hypothetical protein
MAGIAIIGPRIANRRCAAIGAALLALSCSAPRGPLVVTDPDPSIKIPAIQKAVREKDQSAIPQLIKDLESDDAAVRMYANHALEAMTGVRLGFRYFAGEDERALVVRKWRDWASHPGSVEGAPPEEINASVEP